MEPLIKVLYTDLVKELNKNPQQLLQMLSLCRRFDVHKHKFQSCEYCMESWFGTCVPKSAMPGGFESQTYKKMNFLLMPPEEALEPGKAI
jgi:hypothetical protein